MAVTAYRLVMMKLAIIGNSGSGKSTLARACAERFGGAYLDLDTVAWRADAPGVRQDAAVAESMLRAFMAEHAAWVVEGCYAGLIGIAAGEADELVFLNPGVAACRSNCRARPWEPHKYPTREAQDANLAMLLDWVAAYETRDDELSLVAHRALYDAHTGAKRELTSNAAAQAYAAGL